MSAVFAPVVPGFHSKACRQECIGKRAAAIEKTLLVEVSRSHDDAEEVGANLIGFLDEDDCAKIARLLATSDAEGLLKAFWPWYVESVKRTAALRAIKEVEASE